MWYKTWQLQRTRGKPVQPEEEPRTGSGEAEGVQLGEPQATGVVLVRECGS